MAIAQFGRVLIPPFLLPLVTHTVAGGELETDRRYYPTRKVIHHRTGRVAPFSKM